MAATKKKSTKKKGKTTSDRVSSPRVMSVKTTKDFVEVKRFLKNGSDSDDHGKKSTDAAHPDLLNALESLRGPVASLTGIPDIAEDRWKCSGVHFHRNDKETDRMTSVTVTLVKKAAGVKRALPFNPQFESTELDEITAQLFAKLIEEAEEFVNGKRGEGSQRELLPPEGATEGGSDAAT